MRTLRLYKFILILTITISSALWSTTPSVINYQGKLSDTNGIPINGQQTMVFKIYDAAIGGNLLWNETQTVDLSFGHFKIQLGATNPLGPAIFTVPTAYLEIEVNFESMTPRIQLVSVPYAMMSGLGLSIETNEITDGTITTNDIEDSAITTDKLKNNAVTTEKIKNDAVTEDKIDSGAVTSEEVRDNSLTSDDLGVGSVTSSEVADNSLTADDLAAGSVSNSELNNTDHFTMGEMTVNNDINVNNGTIKYTGTKPTRSIILTALSSVSTLVNGATITKSTGAHTMYMLSYPKNQFRSGQWQWVMPANYDGGKINVTLYWSTPSGRDHVDWHIATTGIGDGDSINQPLGPATIIDPDSGGTDKLTLSTTGQFLPDSWAPSDIIIFQVSRNGSSDSINDNVYLLKVRITYNITMESE